MSMQNGFNDSVNASLKSLFTEGRKPHAVLIDGLSDEKRMELALLTAKMLVCDQKENTPCGVCENCRKASDNVHPDIVIIEKPEDKKHFVKADVKSLVADAYLTPNEASVKVYIIKDMHLMNEESQNVLLKILEEPPHYTAFVITSQSANAIIGTIISRVVRLRLGQAEEIKFSDKAVGVAKALTRGIVSTYEYDKVAALAPIEGNKTVIAEVIDLLTCILRDAISLKSGGNVIFNDFREESRTLSDGLSLSKLLDMYETVDSLYRSLETNPNYTLLAAVLCVGI